MLNKRYLAGLLSDVNIEVAAYCPECEVLYNADDVMSECPNCGCENIAGPFVNMDDIIDHIESMGFTICDAEVDEFSGFVELSLSGTVHQSMAIEDREYYDAYGFMGMTPAEG